MQRPLARIVNLIDPDSHEITNLAPEEAERRLLDDDPAATTAKLYALKGEAVGRGVRRLLGVEMPIFPKRRFQHGAAPAELAERRFGVHPEVYRQHFLKLHVPR